MSYFDVLDIHTYSMADLVDVSVIERLYGVTPVITEHNHVAMADVVATGTDSYYFLLDSDDAKFWKYSLVRNPNLYDEFKRANLAPKEETVALKDQYPEAFAEWEAAGGVEDNFRAHLLGIGALPVDGDALQFLGRQNKANALQLEQALDSFPFS